MHRPALAAAISLLTLFVAAAPAQSAPSKGPSADDHSNEKVKVRLVLDVDAVKAGESFRAGVLFKIAPHWHIYWRTPGEAGLPTKVEWEGTDVSFGAIQMPAPKTFGEGGGALTTYGYDHEVLIFSDVKTAPGVKGEAEVLAAISYLACEKECIPGEATLQRSIKFAATTKPASDAERTLFDRYAAEVARTPSERGFSLAVTVPSGGLAAGSPFHALVDVMPCASDPSCTTLSASAAPPAHAFVPDVAAGIDDVSAVKAGAHPSTAGAVRFEIEGRASASEKGEARLRGVLQVLDATGKPAWLEVDEALPRAAVAPVQAAVASAAVVDVPKPAAGEELSLWYVLLLAFLGGMILNLMPCVFPVLALKVYGFINLVQEDKRHLAVHSASYTAGIVGSMMALAATVVGLRAAGHGVGWGFQFQEPLFVAGISALLVAFAMNLFGLFEVGASVHGVAKIVDEGSGITRSIGEGVLAVLLATPCSAPFLGTAVGFALTSSPAVIFAVFASLGFGLALPFVALVMIPGAARILPKPGEWMNHGKTLLGFFLLATVVWLIWVLGQQTGIDVMTGVIAFLLVVAMGAWMWGLGQRASPRGTAVAMVLAAVSVSAAGYAGLPWRSKVGAARALAHAPSEWIPFDEAAVHKAAAGGYTVFVDFTADWCITCKVNERMVIARDDVKRVFAEHNVMLFKADWTRQDENIRAVLEKHGKGGVPMYLLYSPGKPGEPRVLPEVLTVDLLVNHVKNAAKAL